MIFFLSYHVFLFQAVSSMHGFGAKAFLAWAWVRWRGKLAPMKNNLEPFFFPKFALKTTMKKGVHRASRRT
jgi:hypothetical protein